MQGLQSVLSDAAPRLVVLLVCSPLIGATLLTCIRNPAAARHAALSNSALTALVSLLVALVNSLPVPACETASITAIIPWLVRDGSPAPLSCVLSLGVDVLSVGPLTWIPWLTFGIMACGSTRAVAELRSWLLLEFCLLAMYAAQDAVTFSFAGLLAIGVLYVTLGRWGLNERRLAAGRFLRTQVAAQLLWWLGLIGMAVAAAWSRQEVVSRIPAIDFRWTALVQSLSLVVRQSIAGFQYWSLTSPMLFAVLLTGVLLRGPWLPFDRGMARWLNAVPGHAAALIVGGWPLVVAYGWLRFLRPAFGDDLAAVRELLAWWTAVSLLVSAWRCWTAVELRQFAIAWCLALQSLGWLGVTDGSRVGATAGWLMLQAAGWSTAVWMLLAGNRRGPWTAAIALLGVLPLWVVPAVKNAAAASPVEVLLLHHLWPTGLAIVGWFAISWAAVRRIVRLLQRGPSSGEEPACDLSMSECLALLPLAGCLLAVVMSPSLWRGL